MVINNMHVNTYQYKRCNILQLIYFLQSAIGFTGYQFDRLRPITFVILNVMFQCQERAHKLTHTHASIPSQKIYLYICVCVCVCMFKKEGYSDGDTKGDCNNKNSAVSNVSILFNTESSAGLLCNQMVILWHNEIHTRQVCICNSPPPQFLQ